MSQTRPAILHLLDAAGAAGEASPARLALIAQAIDATPEFDHRALLLGPAWMDTLLGEVGLAPHAVRRQVPFNHAALGYRAARAIAREWREPDLVHAWSAGAARLARWAFRGTPVHDASQTRQPITPSVDADLVVGSTRQPLRRRWGVGETVKLVAMLSDGSGDAAVMAGALAVGLARECLEPQRRDGLDVTLLVHPRARGLSLVLDMMGQLGWRGGLVQDAALARPWHTLPACDAALMLGPALGTEPLWAAAAHVPIIAERGGAVTDRLAKRGGAVRVEPNTPRQAGYQLVELIRNPRRVHELTAAAADALEETFNADATAASLRARYAAALPGVAAAS